MVATATSQPLLWLRLLQPQRRLVARGAILLANCRRRQASYQPPQRQQPPFRDVPRRLTQNGTNCRRLIGILIDDRTSCRRLRFTGCCYRHHEPNGKPKIIGSVDHSRTIRATIYCRRG